MSKSGNWTAINTASETQLAHEYGREITQINALQGKIYANASQRLHPMSASLPTTEIDQMGTHRIAKTQVAI
jgi:hypothetical protein